MVKRLFINRTHKKVGISQCILTTFIKEKSYQVSKFDARFLNNKKYDLGCNFLSKSLIFISFCKIYRFFDRKNSFHPSKADVVAVKIVSHSDCLFLNL